jgi:5-methylcytosine-specific restriction endonuclease McrA
MLEHQSLPHHIVTFREDDAMTAAILLYLPFDNKIILFLTALIVRKTQRKVYDERYNLTHTQERRLAKRAYNAAHAEERKAYATAHYKTQDAASTEKQKIYGKAYYEAHREERKAYSIAYGNAHAEQCKNYARTYYATHKEEHKAYSEAHAEHRKVCRSFYRKENPEKARAVDQRARAKRTQAPVNDFTAQQWREMQAAYEHRCVYCGKRGKGKLTMDHIQPLSKGGSHTLSNIVPACKSCNSRKQAGPVLAPVQPLML